MLSLPVPSAWLFVLHQIVQTMSLLFGRLEPMVVVLLLVFPFFMWAGVSFLLLLVKHHGSVAAAAANVIRKIIAVAFSFVYFGRPVTVPIAIGSVLVFASIVYRAYMLECGSSGGGHGSGHGGKAELRPDVDATVDRNPEVVHADADDDDEEGEEASLLSPSLMPKAFVNHLHEVSNRGYMRAGPG